MARQGIEWAPFAYNDIRIGVESRDLKLVPEGCPEAHLRIGPQVIMIEEHHDIEGHDDYQSGRHDYGCLPVFSCHEAHSM